MKKILKLIFKVISLLLYPLFAIMNYKTDRSRVIIESPSGNILVTTDWLGSGKYGLPGGGIKKNENPGQGAAREVLEELNLKIDPKKLISKGRIVHNHRFSIYNIELFYIKLSDNPTPTPLWYEVSDASWINPDDLSKKNSSYDLLLCLKTCYNKDYV